MLRTSSKLKSKMNFSTVVKDEVVFYNNNNAKIVTLNRPEKLNSLNSSMIETIKPKYIEYARSPLTNLIIQNSSASGRAFCAGGDVVSCYNHNIKNQHDKSISLFKSEYALNYLIATFPKPIISILDGITMGGGVGLSVHTPFRIATENTLWAMPEMDIGFFPDVGSSFALSRLLPSYLGYYLALTGDRLSGLDTYFCGLSTHYIPSSSLKDVVHELVSVSASSSTPAVRLDALINSRLNDLTEPLPQDYKFKYSDEQLKLMSKLFTKDATVESIIAGLEQHQAHSAFAKDTLRKLLLKSPLSLKVSLELLQRAENSTIKQVLLNDITAAKQFMLDSDFNTGVEAKLVKKLKTPTDWKYKPIDAIHTKDLLRFFKPDSSLTSVFKDEEDALNLKDFDNYKHNFGLPSVKRIEQYLKENPLTTDSLDVYRHFKQFYKEKPGLKEYLVWILNISYDIKPKL